MDKKKFVEQKLTNCVVDNFCFAILTTISILLLVGGFLVPPMGVIDGSVLSATGILFGFATLGVVIKAINNGLDAKIKHKNIEIDLNND